MAEWNPSWVAAMSQTGPMNDEPNLIECPKCSELQEAVTERDEARAEVTRLRALVLRP